MYWLRLTSQSCVQSGAARQIATANAAMCMCAMSNPGSRARVSVRMAIRDHRKILERVGEWGLQSLMLCCSSVEFVVKRNKSISWNSKTLSAAP